jgi:hypothetical protein
VTCTSHWETDSWFYFVLFCGFFTTTVFGAFSRSSKLIKSWCGFLLGEGRRVRS